MPLSWKKKPTTWLSSLDILKVMKQYENVYKSFVFIGPTPMDFDKRLYKNECVWNEICKFDLSEYIRKGKRKIGIIFNLDPHDKEGSHWVCSFIDIKKKEIYYFDSYGEKTPKEVITLSNRIIDQAKQLGLKYTFIENTTRHQYSDSECGVYCLYIIIKLIEGRSFQTMMKQKIKDKTMVELRKKYFN
tara:strand:- start:520 stop:1083 length:564 start_codon:yes stop_codon:yes gene_type:complete